MSRFVEVVNGSPRLKAGALASTIFGTVALGHFYGVIDAVGLILGGFYGAVDAVGAWISDTVIGGLFSYGAEATGAAWSGNVAFIEGLGALGLVVAALEVAVVTAIFLWATRTGYSRLLGGG